MSNELIMKGQKAQEVSRKLMLLSSNEKNNALEAVAEALIKREAEILEENGKDLESAKEKGITGALMDRLTLNHNRIEGIAEGLKMLINLEDPVGEVLWMKKRPNGLQLGQKRVPLGVIGIIYEARPNVTVDAFGLCFKTGNAVILRGGSEAIHANTKIVEIIQDALMSIGLPAEAVQLLEDTSRETAKEMMRLNQYIDVLIPRGGAGLIKTVVENSTIPVIETGVGNCHVYIDSEADINMAVKVAYNAKTHRPGVCNACESILINKEILDKVAPLLIAKLQEGNVEIRGDEEIKKYSDKIVDACEEDWSTEYLDYIVSMKTVANIEEAINHINTYGSKHSEAIITNNYEKSNRFLDAIDAAAVYVNASTRFTDGFEFGFGAEIGISTQKLHARGPMGLKELTTTKYIIYGNGQIRE
ncbi:glutamate-5-semialdehyde dehydrogenase [Natranaerovirga pectinivora]|uniref:Gamma-glutamyl phosphate reductase n=1 Tax=Natranaerovirga pectinivora TaxID=682400 RepID=A0A4R3MRD3_9FIRM|nr:glutamate-5-semialdehyde dehydrogenase [Natranaerovirga pectinivora]TCT17073.1 glutamate-5-semialdehyde dehydrogenase [Natranaerovirga pectinivora]